MPVKLFRKRTLLLFFAVDKRNISGNIIVMKTPVFSKPQTHAELTDWAPSPSLTGVTVRHLAFTAHTCAWFSQCWAFQAFPDIFSNLAAGARFTHPALSTIARRRVAVSTPHPLPLPPSPQARVQSWREGKVWPSVSHRQLMYGLLLCAFTTPQVWRCWCRLRAPGRPREKYSLSSKKFN